ncbi:hypothetical protein AAG747_16050 [Rapidithrix thailandica]|uniref:Uncharacterized protein n=1 Tax=Rapidithrix thailandica TaxID=413964 RepID=A0AAW9S8U2_9BACT
MIEYIFFLAPLTPDQGIWQKTTYHTLFPLWSENRNRTIKEHFAKKQVTTQFIDETTDRKAGKNFLRISLPVAKKVFLFNAQKAKCTFAIGAYLLDKYKKHRGDFFKRQRLF